VDSEGPSYSQFLSLFYRLRRLIKDEIKYPNGSSIISNKFLPLFRLYSIHLCKNQLPEPASFPIPLLAIATLWSLDPTYKKWAIFNLLKFSDNLTRDVFNILFNGRNYVIQEKSGELILKGKYFNRFPDPEKAPKSLIEWLIKVYLVLCTDVKHRNVQKAKNPTYIWNFLIFIKRLWIIRPLIYYFNLQTK
jgi:hypothetical protein